MLAFVYNDLVPNEIIVMKKKVIVLGVLSVALVLATATFAITNVIDPSGPAGDESGMEDPINP